MNQDYSRLPYRRCAGVMLFNDQKKVWIGRRIPKWGGDQPNHFWQMPQGGIDEGETPEEAAMRELAEETGTANGEIIAECTSWLTYDLPQSLLGSALKGRYRGQTQKWFAMRFLGSDEEFDVGPKDGHLAEFDAWRWAEISELTDLIVPFKRQVYEQLVKEFGRFARD